MESHVVPWLQFNPPAIVLPFGCTWHQAKHRAKPLDRKRLYHYAAIIEGTQLQHSLFEKLASSIAVQFRTRTEIIDSCFNQLSVLVEDINCEEFPTNFIV